MDYIKSNDFKPKLKDLEKLLKIEDYSEFIKKLKKLVRETNIEDLISAGRIDGNVIDEKFTVTLNDIPVKELIPTQNEIDINKGLLKSLRVRDEKIQYSILNGIDVEILSPIVVLNGKYILDGHHRWARVFCMNSDSTIKSLSINNKEIEPLDMLKILQMSISIEKGDIPYSKVESDNILNMSLEKIKEFVKLNLTKKAVLILKETKKIDNKSKKEAVEYIMKNIQLMLNNNPIKNAPSRNIMPQTNMVQHSIKNLRLGVINYKQPFIKTENKHYIINFKDYFRDLNK